MCALLGYSPLVQDNDVVSILHCTQAMCHDNHCLVREKPLQVLHDGSLIVSVKGIGRLVKKQIARILICGPGNENALSLSRAKAVPVRPDLCAIAKRQTFYPTVYV